MCKGNEERMSVMGAVKKKDNTLFNDFSKFTVTELQDLIYLAETREEKIFYTRLLNLKMTFKQEKVVGKELL